MEDRYAIVSTNIKEISRYGNITLAVSPETLLGAGFEPADIILVKIGEHEMEMPVGTCYNDADSGEPVCSLFTDPEGSSGWVVLAVNAGNMAAEMEIAGIADTGEPPGYKIVWEEGIDCETSVTLSMVQKQGFIEEYRMHRAGGTRTNKRADYAALSDEGFTNFREIKTAGMAPGILFRSSSPVNPALNRNKEADAALQRAGIRTVINLTDSEDRMKKYEGYPLSGYAKCDIAALNMGMDFFTEEFRKKLAEGFRFLAAHDGPYLIHCNEGKDRAGFAAAILESLMGADLNEIAADYMLSFVNYYGIVPESDQYRLISAGNIEASLARAFGTGMKSRDGECLSECAEKYLRKAGMKKEEIRLLKRKLGGTADSDTGGVKDFLYIAVCESN